MPHSPKGWFAVMRSERAVYRAMMRKAAELAAERGITQAQAFEKLLVAREPEFRSLVKCARGR